MSDHRRSRNRRKQRAARAVTSDGVSYQQALDAGRAGRMPVSLDTLCSVLESPPSGPVVAGRLLLVGARRPVKVTGLPSAPVSQDVRAHPPVVVVDVPGGSGVIERLAELWQQAKQSGSFVVAVTDLRMGSLRDMHGTAAVIDWPDYCVAVDEHRRVTAIKNRFGTLLTGD